MAREDHVRILLQGRDVWNRWRNSNPDISPDLSNADLTGVDLRGPEWFKSIRRWNDIPRTNLCNSNLSHSNLRAGIFIRADLRGANLRNSDLRHTELIQADLRYAILQDAILHGVFLMGADLRGVDLQNANLVRARLDGADLRSVNLINSDLSQATMEGANLDHANISGSRVYGISTWNVDLEATLQSNLVITETGTSLTVDNLKTAQMIYLMYLMRNDTISSVIDALTKKVVLILGNFRPSRKIILDKLKYELQTKDLIPVVFDFDKPESRDLTETVSTIAHISRFIIADITDPRSIPQELKAIVPNLPSVVVQPICQSSMKEYSLFEHFKNFHWVLPIYHYLHADDLVEHLEKDILDPVQNKLEALHEK